MIDGGSTDGSRNLLEIYKKYFSYWCSEPDKGVYNAQNKGISVAKGEYMSFMNSGDEFYDKDTLKNVFMNEPKADILYGDWVHRYSNSEKIQYAPHEMSLIYIFTDNICHQAMFIRSSLLRQKGYDENMKIFSDWKRWREAVLARNTFQYVPHVICKFDAGGISGTPSQQNAYERQLLYDAIPKEFKSSVNEHAKLKEKLYRYDGRMFTGSCCGIISTGNTGKPNCCSGTGRTDTGSTASSPCRIAIPAIRTEEFQSRFYIFVSRNNYSVNPKTLL